MDFTLTPELERLRDVARKFAGGELAPQALNLDEKGEFPFEALKKAANLGLVGIINSKEYGGSDMGHLARMIMMEEISSVYAPLGFYFQTGHIGMYVLQNFSSEELRRKYLPPLCAGDEALCYSLTEPTGGSEPSTLQTTAQLVGNEYVVNGRKVFASSAGAAKIVCFVAKTAVGPSLFLVEKGTPGFAVPKREQSLGMRSLPVGDLAFSSCRIPRQNLIGEEGRGLGMALTAIAAIGRPGAAAVSLGIAQGAYQAALKFAMERNLYGKPIIQLQAIQFALVDLNVEIEAARWLCYYAAWLLDQGKSPREIGSVIARAKLYATEVANKVCSKSVQILGGYGLAPEYHVARRLRDAQEMWAAAGTQEIMRVTIGAGIVKQ